MDFHIGDRVRPIFGIDSDTLKEYFPPRCKMDSVATVKWITAVKEADLIFDDDVGGHSLNSECANGHGWYGIPFSVLDFADDSRWRQPMDIKSLF